MTSMNAPNGRLGFEYTAAYPPILRDPALHLTGLGVLTGNLKQMLGVVAPSSLRQSSRQASMDCPTACV